MKSPKVIFGISVLLLLVYIIVLLQQFSSVQEIIPVHYSGDGFGSKNFLWLEVGLNFLLLCLLALPIFFPERMFAKTTDYLESSTEAAIKNRQVFLSVLSVLVTIIFLWPFAERNYLFEFYLKSAQIIQI